MASKSIAAWNLTKSLRLALELFLLGALEHHNLSNAANGAEMILTAKEGFYKVSLFFRIEEIFGNPSYENEPMIFYELIF